MKKKLSNRGKKILAVILALVVACSVLPNTSLFGDRSVFAAGEDEGETELTKDMFTCSSTTLEYTGNAITNPVSVASGYSLTEDTDYTTEITYSDDTASEYIAATEIMDVGYYKITMTGMGSYAGTVTFDVTVAQSIASYTLRITGSEDYGLPTVGIISADNQTLVQDEDYTLTFYSGSDEVAALEDGTPYTLTVSGTGLYTGEITKQYEQAYASADDSTTSYILTPGTDVALFGSWYNGDVTASLRNSQPGSGFLIWDSANGYADISTNDSTASSVACNAEGTNYFYLTNDSVERNQVYCYRVLVDSTAPTLSADLNTDGWAASKTISITDVSDSTSGICGVYYAIGTNILSVDTTGTVTEAQLAAAVSGGKLTAVTVSEDGSAEIGITDALDETGTTYYIYAIDNAGNVTATSVDVSKIDTSAPEITVDKDYADEDGGFQDTYWKSGDALTISFTVTDDTVSVSDESSLGSITVQKLSDGSYSDCDRDDASVAWSSTDQKYVLTVNTEGSYRIVVTDGAGNSYTSDIFEVKQDSSAPTVSADAENAAGYTVTDADGNYCFADSLMVTLTVKDETGEADNAQSDVTVSVSVTVGSTTTEYEYALQTLLTDAGVFTSVTDNEDGTYILLYEMKESGSVSFSVADEINAADETSVSAKKYADEPSVALDYASGSAPTQVTESGTTIDYFNSESIENLDLLANITDESGITLIEYEITGSTDTSFNKSGSRTYDVSAYGQDGYTSFTDQSLADLSGIEDILTGLEDGSCTVTYTVTNVLGNTASASISFSVDTAAPDEDIYVAYTSDSDVTDASDYYSSGLGGTVSRLINTLTERIFGKTNVYFTLYLKDADGDVVSGIDADALIADGNIMLDSDVDSGVTLTVNADSVTTAEADLITDDAEVSGTYTVVRGVISTTSEDELDSLNHILIREVDDMAGNSLTEIDGAAILGTDNVILDNVHPDVSVSYPAYNESDGDNYYYSPDSDSSYEAVMLTYTEKYFEENLDEDGEMVLPSLQVSTDGGSYTDVSDAESEEGDTPYVEWNKTKVSDGTLTATVYLPYSTNTDDGEIEYLIQTSYTDGSGNILTRVTDDGMSSIDADTGLYQSETLVLDETAPVVDLAYGTYSLESGFTEADPSASYDDDDHSYYNETDGIWLQVCVQDENIRYAEVLDYLIDSLTATDINGDDITEDTAAYQYLQTMMEQNKSLAVRGTLTLYIPLTDDAYYDLASGTVTDLAQNVSDTVAEQHICTDYTMPEDDILVEYAADIGTGFEDTFQGLALYREYLFGRESMDVTLYIRDNLSGVQTISYQYDGTAAQTAERDGDLVDYKGDGYLYAAFTLSLPVTAYSDGDDILINENLIVSVITDRAGNVRTENGTTAAYTGDTELIIDNVNPDVQVTYPASDDDGTYEDYYFYSQDGTQSDEVVTLVYTERYFRENVETDEDGYAVYTDGEKSWIYPAITVEMDGETITVSDAVSETQPYVEWGKYNTSDYTIEAQLHLPYSTDEDGAEIEYVIETEYTDGSGNVLVRNTDDSFSTISEDGVYRSETLVLDNKAPELLSYTISGTTDREVDGVPVYRSVDGDDVTLTWVIDDNDKYWNPSDLTFTIRNVTTGEVSVQISGDDASIEWDPDGQAGERMHTGEYTFDGDADPANYYVTVSCADRAANALISGNEELTVENGIYQSAEFILDHTAPVFNISYTKAYRLVKDSDTAQSNDKKNTVPTTGYTAYYSTDIDVTIDITEDYAVEQTATGSDGEEYIIGLTDYTIQVGGVLTASYTPEYSWTYDESTKTYTMSFTLSAEDYYRLSVSYTDAAGNVMTKGSAVQGSYTSLDSTDLNGSYGSTLLVIDKTAPQITGSYSSTVIDETAGRYYFNGSTTLTLTVTDSNIRNQELKDAVSADNAYVIENAGTNIFSSTSAYASLNALNGSTIYTRQDKTQYTLRLNTQANYDLLITGYEDLAGNTAVITDYNPYVCVDTVSPTNVTFTYSVDSVGTWEAINYAKLGYVFANSKLTVKAAAKDVTAGLKLFTFYVTDENGTVTTIVRTVDPTASASETITVPLSGNDFKGSVEVVVTDWSGNTNSKIEGQIVQSASRHASAGSATITTLTSPSRTVNGVDYYNTDVTFHLTMKETYAGLRSYSYTAGSLISASFDYSAQAGYDLTQSKSYEITDTFSANLTLAASANNQNDVSVEASYIDNTGYTGSVSKTYNIDITKPTIEVTYDNNSPTNETYYKDTRTATVVITERNFDADDVVFTITNTDGTMPTISGWTTSGSGDATKHTATVTFSADGDYTFTVAFQDLAGNKADYSTVDEFTIDKTIPTYTVTYDNNSYQNEYYYDANRVATIDILEHNFDTSAVTITVTRDGSTITPVISGWTRNGDHNIATVSFNTDGDYTFTISGVDLAENPMDDYTMDQFVVDTEVPEIEIYNIENYSANNGVVQPGIRYSDTNCDSNAAVVEMIGYYNGTVSMDGQKTITSEGVEILMDDFEHVQEMDDMYTMTATVYDLAGNSSEASVTFSVNRFGSVYTFDNATGTLVGENGSYYTNEEPTIVVYETNVDTLESGEIAKNLNGDLNTLEEDEDYTVKVSGDEVSWKQYTYTLDSSNFEMEGEYILTFISQDRATNYNTNETQIGFVVDKTAPTVLISGITDGEQLREETHDIVISAADNVRLDYVTVVNDNESTEYDSEDVTDGSFTHTLSSKDERQSLQVIATDAAGNQSTVMSIVDESGNVVEELEALTYLLTTNLWIQFISNTPLLIGVIAVIAAVVVLLLWWFLFGKKRRKKDEESAQVSS